MSQSGAAAIFRGDDRDVAVEALVPQSLRRRAACKASPDDDDVHDDSPFVRARRCAQVGARQRLVEVAHAGFATD